MNSKKNILITGGAGFIGSHLIDYLINDGNYSITCVDNFDNFYDPEIKRKNIESHITNSDFKLIEADITDKGLFDKLEEYYDIVVHLAAKAGVRPSIQDPVLYQHVNVVGLQNILEIGKRKSVKQFVFGSSSSVYGVNPNYPWKESDTELMPVSPYASSKIAGEWIGKTYSRLYDMRFIALRFFTVFGPRQRPDLAINNFIEMRAKTADPKFLLQKKIEAKLHERYPDKWIPAYSQVTFSPHIRYSEALKNSQKQEAIMQGVMEQPDIEEKWDSGEVEKLILQKL